jgi:hypothetical protein
MKTGMHLAEKPSRLIPHDPMRRLRQFARLPSVWRTVGQILASGTVGSAMKNSEP